MEGRDQYVTREARRYFRNETRGYLKVKTMNLQETLRDIQRSKRIQAVTRLDHGK
jgi:hypothetical protein